MSNTISDLSHDDCYMLYNALVYHRNALTILVNHETADIQLLRMYRGQITKLNYLIDILKEFVK